MEKPGEEEREATLFIIELFFHSHHRQHPMANASEAPAFHTINPADRIHPLLSLQEEHTSIINNLVIHTDANLKIPHTDFTDFLDRLQGLRKLIIRWNELHWIGLEEHQLCSFIQLFCLPSLQELYLLGANNFPLGVLLHFKGRKLCIEGIALTSAVMPIFPARVDARELGALTHLQLNGAQNIREFQMFIEWQKKKAHAFLQSVSFLQCNIQAREDDVTPEKVMEDLGPFLVTLGSAARCLEEFRFINWQNVSFNGPHITHSDLVSLTSLKRLHLHLGASHKGKEEKTMETLDASFRIWLFPFLSNLPSPRLLESVVITFSFFIPFPWPTDLHEWMKILAVDLDTELDRGFPELRTARLTYNIWGAHTRSYDWKTFNIALRPSKLNARGVACTFNTHIHKP
ncbi:hypothetical protein NP233_g4748 [Leucocoprinus birnbaumii]|uniref:Uncharacterized protein n=1 Tax=Leucocoprinus birnbaumii TaxID=56174 RepID=A0AAD5YV79_9AGAR|nr:hypothetical protein NP233_g4748 [Leucocoprinus birnbaumii]